MDNRLPERFAVPDDSAIEESRTLPQTVADAGYVTGLVGKYHLGVSDKPQLASGNTDLWDGELFWIPDLSEVGATISSMTGLY